MAIGLSWFVAMFAIYGKRFWQLHIIETHFQRVTSSIEFHFGQKTFYLDLARQEMGVLFWMALIGLIVVLIKYNKKNWKLFNALYLLPWFIFLNLTRTKIFWYFFAVIPQFGFLATAPLLLFKKRSKIYHFFIVLLIAVLFYQSVITRNVLATVYSKPEPHYYLSRDANGRCNRLYVLIDSRTRNSFAQLERLGLLITTTKWWGSHPSMVYYFEKPIEFVYSQDKFISSSQKAKKGDCIVIDSTDAKLSPSKKSYTYLNSFGSLLLFVKK